MVANKEALEDPSIFNHPERYEGEEQELWINYDRLVFELDQKDKNDSLSREGFNYFIFFLVFAIFVLAKANIGTVFELEQSLKNTFIDRPFVVTNEATGNYITTFPQLKDEHEFWEWTKKVLYPSLYTEGKVGNETMVAKSNILLWGVRFNQKRVKHDEPCVSNLATQFGMACIPQYNSNNRAMSIAYVPSTDPYLYTWKPATALKEASFSGKFSTYEGDGFILETGKDPQIALANITDMANASNPATAYIDRYTSAVVISFNLYNVNNNHFTAMTMAIEFAATGNDNTFVTVMHFLFNILIVVNLVRFIVKLRKGTSNLSVFNVIEVANFVIFAINIVHSIRWDLIGVDRTEIEMSLGRNEYYQLRNNMLWPDLMKELYGTNMILCSLRFFQFLRLLPGIELVHRTLTRAVEDISMYFILFGLMFLAFTLCGFLVFGPLLEDFKDMGVATISLLRMALGDFKYTELRNANPSFAPIFFLFFTIIFFFLLMNIFLAIVLDSWQRESEKYERQRQERDQRTVLLSWWQEMIEDFVFGVVLAGPFAWWGAILTVLGSPDGTLEGFLEMSAVMDFHEMVLRLQVWKKKQKNKDKVFVNFQQILEALQGHWEIDANVKLDTMLRIFDLLRERQRLAERQYLFSEEEKVKHEQRLKDRNSDFSSSEEKNRYHLTGLKRLNQSFVTLRASQAIQASSIHQKLSNLSTVQSKLVTLVDGLDAKMETLIPSVSQFGSR